MTKRDENFLELLSQCPWWVSVMFSGLVYAVLRFILPAVQFENWLLQGFAHAGPTIALPLSLVLLLPTPFSYFDSRRKRKLLNKQIDLDSIRLLSWKEFEELVGEAYRRKGYSVVENHGVGSDSGIDLRLNKAGNLFLVQCKHWKVQKGRCPRRPRDVRRADRGARFRGNHHHVGAIHSGRKDFCRR